MSSVQSNYSPRQQRRKTPLWTERRAGAGRRSTGVLSAAEKGHILILLVAIGIIGIGVIIAGAYAAMVNYHNNELKEQNAALQSEVQSMEIDLESATNLANIEKKASKELGMVYPDGDSLVVIKKSASASKDTGLAANLKKNAFE